MSPISLLFPHHLLCRVLDILTTLNSRPCYLALPAVLIVEKSQYYYLIVIFISITSILILMILVCRDILFILIIVHVRGLYGITMSIIWLKLFSMRILIFRSILIFSTLLSYQINSIVRKNPLEIAISEKNMIMRNKIVKNS